MRKWLICMCLILGTSFAAEASNGTSRNYSQREIECLARNIYFEARGESQKGKEFVAWVTINRGDHSKYPDNLCNVVYQRSQFSWTSGPERISEKSAWLESQEIAQEVASKKRNGANDPTDGSIMFHAKGRNPSWTRSYERTYAVGNHVFYRD